jgi:hypothetical protein
MVYRKGDGILIATYYEGDVRIDCAPSRVAAAGDARCAVAP